MGDICPECGSLIRPRTGPTLGEILTRAAQLLTCTGLALILLDAVCVSAGLFEHLLFIILGVLAVGFGLAILARWSLRKGKAYDEHSYTRLTLCFWALPILLGILSVYHGTVLLLAINSS